MTASSDRQVRASLMPRRASADLLDLRSYHDPAIFEHEAVAVFARGWHFAGTTRELAHNNDFVTLDLPRRSIVVQNFRGELRAFENICSHRLNRIQTETRGRRPLMCGYHNWTFDQSGFPVGRPNREQFPADTAEERARLCLPSYRVATCGIFVFVDLTGDAGELTEFLGGKVATLDAISVAVGEEIHFGAVAHRANWKLLVENVLECYHCQAVHPDTFVAGLGVGRATLDQVLVDNAHSSCHFPRTPGKRDHLRDRLLAHLEQRSFRHDSFFHLYIFPNLFVSSQEGLTFYIGQALPRGATETELRTRMYEPLVALEPKARTRQDAMNAQSVALGTRVPEEDRLILENIQRSLPVATSRGILGDMERRISAFHARYEEALGLTPTESAPEQSPV